MMRLHVQYGLININNNVYIYIIIFFVADKSREYNNADAFSHAYFIISVYFNIELYSV